ncbi:hypothetical protein [Gimesia fumaroli]|uniref:Uncharacterized protein n=1 Tax=Gimesia fumaroli TaxID=2527976 RepID=A0A518IHD4_9PLAN|nr:hypothetical protein [Gimesia fumaroli]QDV52501.1 hypothetical protein Enr17x_45640 [Gimesia fumaroli]
MKKLLIVCVAVAGLAFVGNTTTAEAGGFRVNVNLGNGYGYYGGRRFRNYTRTPQYYGRRHSFWHDTSHYDYHPGQFYRHGNHFHYQPGHYDYHQTGHWDHH